LNNDGQDVATSGLDAFREPNNAIRMNSRTIFLKLDIFVQIFKTQFS
jgi:hypothetical protein